MKAWVLHDVDKLRFEDVPKPVIRQGEVLVRVKATGICGSDIPRIYETGAHSHPLIPGHEFAGKVVEIAKDVDSSWKGKRVGVFPLIPCRECYSCKKNQYELCKNYDYLGSRRDGGFAECVAVPEWNLIELPEKVSYQSSAMLEPMAVAVHAMRRVNPRQGETVVICGLGTIGLLLLMFLKNELMIDSDISNNNILIIGNKEFQRKQVIAMGMPEASYCDSREQDVKHWINEKTSEKGADVFFECVGKNDTISQAVDLTASAGRVCFVGNPYSDIHLEKNVYWKILRNQLMITGTWNSSFNHEDTDDWHYVLRKLDEGVVKPENLISHLYTIEELEKGFHIMRDKSEDYIKIMMTQAD